MESTMRSRMGEGETFMDGMTAKPTALIVKPDTIPGEIKAPQAWVTWRYELEKDKIGRKFLISKTAG
jgi:hypothetical protein